MRILFQSILKLPRATTILLILPPVIAAVWAWTHAYSVYWRQISEQEAARIAQGMAVKYCKALRAEGWLWVSTAETWRLRGTNATVGQWMAYLSVTRSNSRPYELTFSVTNGASGWMAQNILSFPEEPEPDVIPESNHKR